MIEIQELSKFYYSDSSVTVALKKISLEFPDQGLVAITGESGSGKTTLLNVISGQIPYDEGEMLMDGEPTFGYDEADWEEYRNEKVGYIFQDYSLIMDYTVLDNVISVMVIMHADMETAKKKAEEYLEKVGMIELADRKARELSSGQKQRLSIARALAKETKVIVADEPTGNLDSETGEQIIKLLKTLSEERLVLLVTHNYQQAEPYVDRKIRIHDGEIVDDIRLNNIKADDGSDKNQSGIEKSQNTKTEDNQKSEKRTSQNKDRAITRYFVKKNRKARPGKAIFYQVFFFAVAFVSLIFIGDFLTQLDEAHSMQISDSYFPNMNDARLIITRKDGGDITSDDMEKIKADKDVISADRYDYIQDINYHAAEGVDYMKGSGGIIATEAVGEDEFWNEMYDVYGYAGPSILPGKKFMRSVTSIEADELLDGSFPDGMYEIVVTEDYGCKVGDKLNIYFSSKQKWGNAEYYGREFTVAGITSGEEQIYFSEYFSRVMGATIKMGMVNMFVGDPSAEPFDFSSHENAYIMVDESLDDEANGYPITVTYGFYFKKDVTIEGDVMCSPLGIYGFVLSVDAPRKFTLSDEEHVLMNQLGKFESTWPFVEVSKEMFEMFYKEDSCQAAVYINNYARTDKVIKRLDKLGYNAVNIYRLSGTGYDDDKLNKRFTRIGIDVAILFALIFFEVLIVAFSVRMNRKDYQVLVSLGMQKKNIKNVIRREQFLYCTTSVVIMAVLATVLMYLFQSGKLSVYNTFAEYLNDILYYFALPSMVCYLAYNYFAGWLTSVVSNIFVRGGRRK